MYEQMVVPTFFFGGFQANPVGNSIIQSMLVLGSAALMPLRAEKMSELFLWLSMLLLLIPAASLSIHQGSDVTTLLMIFAGAWLAYGLTVIYPRLGIFGDVAAAPSIKIMRVPMTAISLVVLILLALHVSGRLSFSFLDVYDIRFDFNDSLYFPLNYMLPFAGGPLAGLIIASALVTGNRLYLIYGIVAGLLFFGLSSHKALMFYPIFALVVFYVIRMSFGIVYFTLGLTALALIALVSTGFIEILLGGSFANRLVFIPAQIHYYFFREFGEIGFQYWAESRVGLGFFESNIPIDSVNYIGQVMTGDASVGANTGWIANGYMNAGFVGIAVYAVIISVILYTIDVLGRRFGYAFVGAAFIVPVSNLVNSIDLLAGLLTGGLGVLFVLFFVLVRAGPDPARSAP